MYSNVHLLHCQKGISVSLVRSGDHRRPGLADEHVQIVDSLFIHLTPAITGTLQRAGFIFYTGSGRLLVGWLLVCLIY